MKKILILGASILQLPGILTAKEMGLYTISLDIDTKAIGRKAAHEFYQVSINDKEKVLEIAASLNVDGIITLASDQPMNTVSYVGTKLNLNVISEEVAISTTNKGIMRDKLRKYNVPIPAYQVINNEKEFTKLIKEFSIPCILKPTDSSGSRGVQLVNNYNDLEEKFKYSSQYSKDHEVIIEEYLVGREFSVESISIDGNSTVIAITEKETSGAPYFVEIGHIIPANITKHQEEEIKDIVIKTIHALEIKNGPTHCEVMLTKEGPKIIEIGARLGGDNITSHLVPLSTGYNMIKAAICGAINVQNTERIMYNRSSLISYINVNKIGRINKINGINEIENSPFLKELILTKEIGAFHGTVTSSSDRIGYFILCGKSRDELTKEANRLNKIISIEIDPLP